jgi:hypothetical protein
MASPGIKPATARTCVYCGKPFAVHLNRCPFCREAVPEVRLARVSGPGGPDGRVQIRRGLLYMFLAAVIHYFAAGYSAPLQVPVFVLPLVTDYLTPSLFLGGLGLTLYGLFLKFKS